MKVHIENIKGKRTVKTVEEFKLENITSREELSKKIQSKFNKYFKQDGDWYNETKFISAKTSDFNIQKS